MKRKAPQTKQTARKSTRNSIRMQNIARQQQNFEDEAEHSADEQSTVMVPKTPLASEELRRQMMTDDETVSTAGSQANGKKATTSGEPDENSAADESTIQLMPAVSSSTDQTQIEQQVDQQEAQVAAQVTAQTEEQVNPAADQANTQTEEQTSPSADDFHSINPLSQIEPATEQQNVAQNSDVQPAAETSQREVNSQQENSDDFIVSIDSTHYSTPPESINGRAAGSQAINSQPPNSQPPNSQPPNSQPLSDFTCSSSLLDFLDNDAAAAKTPDEAVSETGWMSEDTVHAFKYKFRANATNTTNKIAAFDLDGTLITPKSNAKFAKDINDWKLKDGRLKQRIEALLKQGFNFVIFSNQMGVSCRMITLKQIKTKFENIVRHLDLPCVALLCTSQDAGRKPAIGMLEVYRKINQSKLDLQKSLFVGDAMGRPKDHSAADLLFAFNCRMPFVPIESFLTGFEQAKQFTYDQISKYRVPAYPKDPAKLKKPEILWKKNSGAGSERDFYSIEELIEEIKSDLSRAEAQDGPKLCVVLLIGLFGSGKSHFANKYLELDYDVIAHEAGRGFEEDQKLFKSHLESGKRRIVIDYPNLDFNDRKRWISLAKAEKATIIGVHFDLNVDQCTHNVRFRSYYTDHDRKAPTPTQLLKQHTLFRAPEYFEGFNRIYKLDFIPSFDVPQKKVYHSHFLYDKP